MRCGGDDEQGLPTTSQHAHAEDGSADRLGARQLFAIGLCQLTEGAQVTLPYTLAVYMVRDFLQAGSAGAAGRPGSTGAAGLDEQEVGWKTGMLAACWCFSQFLTSFAWGRASDRLGRKWLVVMSNVSSTVSVVAFGLASSFGAAVAARLAGGLLNCTFVCLKSMCGEAGGSAAGQARAMTLLSLAWGVGTVAGPVLGGALALPCDRAGVPLCAPGQLLRRRPFLLPCLATALLSAAATASSVALLRETRRAQPAPRRGFDRTDSAHACERPDGVELAAVEAKLLPRREPGEAGGGSGIPAQRGGPPPYRDSRPGAAGARTAAGARPPASAFAAAGDQAAGAPARRQRAPLRPLAHEDSAACLHGAPAGPAGALAGAAELEAEPLGAGKPGRAPPGAADGEGDALLAVGVSASRGERPWYSQRQVVLTLGGYALLAMLFNLIDELAPLFASTPRALGGLGLAPAELAVPLAVSGVALAVSSLGPERAPQEDSTLERLRQEHDVLTGTVSYLRAKLALEGAFNADAEGGGGEGGGSSGGEAT